MRGDCLLLGKEQSHLFYPALPSVKKKTSHNVRMYTSEVEAN